MKRSISADLVLTAHFLFAVFAVFGAFGVLLDWRVLFAHIPTVIWASVVNLANWTCPMTPLEKKLRRRVGQPVYEGGCVQNKLKPLVRLLGTPRHLELAIGFAIVVWNLIAYGIVLWLRGGSA